MDIDSTLRSLPVVYSVLVGIVFGAFSFCAFLWLCYAFQVTIVQVVQARRARRNNIVLPVEGNGRNDMQQSQSSLKVFRMLDIE